MARKKKKKSDKRKRGNRKEGGSSYLNLGDISKLKIENDDSKRLDFLEFEVQEKKYAYAEQGEMHYEKTFYVHRNINNKTYVCPKETYGKKCPICEYRDSLDWDNGDEEEMKAIKAKERQLFNVVDLGDPDKGVQVWEYSYHLFGKKLDVKLDKADDDEKEEYDNFADAVDGKTTKLVFEEVTQGKAKWFEVNSIDFKKRKADYEETETHDLNSLLVCLSYDELKAALEGGDDEDDEEPKKKEKESDDNDDDDEETKKDKKEKKAKKPKCFGDDDKLDSIDDCDDCKFYDDCEKECDD